MFQQIKKFRTYYPGFDGGRTFRPQTFWPRTFWPRTFWPGHFSKVYVSDKSKFVIFFQRFLLDFQ